MKKVDKGVVLFDEICVHMSKLESCLSGLRKQEWVELARRRASTVGLGGGFDGNAGLGRDGGLGLGSVTKKERPGAARASDLVAAAGWLLRQREDGIGAMGRPA